MQAYAEGYELLEAAELVDRRARRCCSPGARAPSSGPGCWTCWSARSTRTRSWPSSRLRRRLRRGPLDHRGGDPARGAAAGDLRGAVRPVRLPAGRLAGDEGGRRAAQPVRRARGEVSGRPVRHPGEHAGPSSGTGSTRAACTCAGSHSPTSGRGNGPSSTWSRGSTCCVGPNGVRQDQPGRGARLPGDPRFAPGRHRRAADPARAPRRRSSARGRARRPRAAGRAGDRAGRANRARVNRAPVTRPRDVLGHAAHGAVRPGGPGAGPRRPERAPALPGRPAGAPGTRATPACAPTTSGCSSSATRCSTAPPARSGGDLRTLDVWDGHLAQHGAELLAGRLELVGALAPHGGRGVRRGGARARSRSRCSVPVEPGRRAADRRRAAAGAAAGRPGTGAPAGGGARRVPGRAAPRRPGAEPRGRPAKGYASHGESWSLALALRLASYRLLRADDVEPVLVLDDVFAELDSRRREALAAVAKRAEQVLVTAAVAADVPDELDGRALHGEWRSSHTKSARCPVGTERVIAQGWGQTCGYCG